MHAMSLYAGLVLALVSICHAALNPRLPVQCRRALLDSYTTLERCGFLDYTLTSHLQSKCSNACQESIIQLNATLSPLCKDRAIFTLDSSFAQSNHSAVLLDTPAPSSSSIKRPKAAEITFLMAPIVPDTLSRYLANLTLPMLTTLFIKTLPLICVKVYNQFCSAKLALTKTSYSRHVTIQPFEEAFLNWIPGMGSENGVGCDMCTEKRIGLLREMVDGESGVALDEGGKIMAERWETSIYYYEKAVGKCRLTNLTSGEHGSRQLMWLPAYAFAAVSGTISFLL